MSSPADTRLDAAIALARRLAQDPGADGAVITVSCAWSNGRPDSLHGALSIHTGASTPAAKWAAGLSPDHREPLRYVSVDHMVDSWRCEVDGVEVGVYLASPIVNEAAPVNAQEAANA